MRLLPVTADLLMGGFAFKRYLASKPCSRPKQFALLGSPGHAYTQETLQTLSLHAFTL
jgi:hypothetical protein